MTQGETNFFLGLRSGELEERVNLGGKVIALLYRMSPEMKLLQARDIPKGVRLQGKIMGIDEGEFLPQGQGDVLCRQVEALVAQHGFGGVACFFSQKNPDLEEAVTGLEGVCRGKGIPLLVPEIFGNAGEYRKVFLSTAISGGTLEGRFRQAMAQYGRNRVVMDIEAMGENFLLPAPNGTGEHLTLPEISTLLAREQGEVFFSGELCARYFTYKNKEHSLRFVLFDDEGSIREKIRLARLWKLWGVAVSLEDYRRGVVTGRGKK